jgi:outer membrane receptor protein involved in Fe transport
VDAGRTITDTCFVADNPQQTTIICITSAVTQRAVEQRFCHEVQSWMANLQVKLNGSAPLPWGTMLSVTYQNVAGVPILADYNATSAQIAPSLGRPLSGGAATVTIPLIAPYTQFEDRRTQLDLRLTKSFSIGPRNGRIQAMADVYNLFNASSVLSRTDTYGRAWGQPTSIVPGRMLQLGARWTF